jgi:ferredoxin
MKTIHFKNEIAPAIINTQERLLDALLSKQVAVKMLCGGRGLCATCHVHVTAGAESLTPKGEREKLTLAVLTGAQGNSRLACQAKVIGDGVQVELPKGLYIESFGQLEALIGKRATQPVLHPITGRILIEDGKIITRTIVNDLKSVDFNFSQVQSQSATV